MKFATLILTILQALPLLVADKTFRIERVQKDLSVHTTFKADSNGPQDFVHVVVPGIPTRCAKA